ncbi:DUF1697 domain-containing protein [Nocardioides pacificus]
MATYLAFLRAINLGARRKYPMAELRAALSTAGFGDVETHIQTGNVRLTTRMRSRARLEEALERVFLADRGFEVPTMVLTPGELATVAADAAELAASGPEGGGHYVCLLKHDPDPDGVAALEALRYDEHRAVVRGRAVHLLVGATYLGSGLDAARVERLLGPATARNERVIRALAQKWAVG